MIRNATHLVSFFQKQRINGARVLPGGYPLSYEPGERAICCRRHHRVSSVSQVLLTEHVQSLTLYSRS
jgi:hypothetical protein